MTEEKKCDTPASFDLLVEHYLGLETMEVTEMLLGLCGASIDTRALPLLKQRLCEEEAQRRGLETHGYIRMSEKCQHLMKSLRLLILALERMSQENGGDQ